MKLPIWKLEPGMEAPDFELPSTGATAGRGGPAGRVRLSAYRGSRNVLLVFYPAAFTPT
jgi:peroxiredoxin